MSIIIIVFCEKQSATQTQIEKVHVLLTVE